MKQPAHVVVWVLSCAMLGVGVLFLIRPDPALRHDPVTASQPHDFQGSPATQTSRHSETERTAHGKPSDVPDEQSLRQTVANSLRANSDGMLKQALRLGAPPRDREDVIRQVELTSLAARYRAAADMVSKGQFHIRANPNSAYEAVECADGTSGITTGQFRLRDRMVTICVCVPHNHELWVNERVFANTAKVEILRTIAQEFNDLDLEERKRRFARDMEASRSIAILRQDEGKPAARAKIAELQNDLLDPRFLRSEERFVLVVRSVED